MEDTTASDFDIDVGEYREYPYTFDQASKDIFTYGPLDIVKKILLDMDFISYLRTCNMNPRLREICRDPDFKRKYISMDENWKEVYDVLKSIILSKRLGDSHVAIYKEWAPIASEAGRWDPSENRNSILTSLIRDGLIKNLELLLRDSRVDPSSPPVILIASGLGRPDIVELLLRDTRVDPSVNANEALVIPSTTGDIATIKLLLRDSRVDPSDFNNGAVMEAVEQGHWKIVELFLKDPRVDPSIDNNEMLYDAVVANDNTFRLVNLLLADPRVNPTDPEHNALRRAVEEGGARKVVKFLLDDPRTDATVNNHEVLDVLYEFPNKKMMELLEKWYKDHGIAMPKPEDIRGESSPDESSSSDEE